MLIDSIRAIAERASFARERYGDSSAHYRSRYSYAVMDAVSAHNEAQRENLPLLQGQCAECNTFAGYDLLTGIPHANGGSEKLYCKPCLTASDYAASHIYAKCARCETGFQKSTMVPAYQTRDHIRRSNAWCYMCVPCALESVRAARNGTAYIADDYASAMQLSFTSWANQRYRLASVNYDSTNEESCEALAQARALLNASQTFPFSAREERRIYLHSETQRRTSINLCDACGYVYTPSNIQGRYSLLTSDNEETGERQTLCLQCFPEVLRLCIDCDECAHPESYEATTFQRLDNNDRSRYACSDCAENYMQCAECDCYVVDTDILETPSGDSWCRECWSEAFFECDSCAEVCSQRRYCCDSMCASCCCDNRDNDHYDEDNDSSGLDSYSADVRAITGIYPMDGALCFGMELEYESASGCSPTDIAEQARERSKKIIVKSDGSLDYGAEIVTAPLSHAEQREVLSDLLGDDLTSARSAKTAGIHIHASLSAMTNAQLARLILFFGAKQNQPFLNAIACRNLVGHGYAELNERSWRKIVCKYDRGSKTNYRRNYDSNRYQALNITSKGTAEFRLFASTKTHDLAQAHLDFVAALIAFCRLPLSLQEAQRAQAFCAFAQRERKAYPYLAKRLARAKFNAWTNAQSTEQNEEDCEVENVTVANVA